MFSRRKYINSIESTLCLPKENMWTLPNYIKIIAQNIIDWTDQKIDTLSLWNLYVYIIIKIKLKF